MWLLLFITSALALWCAEAMQGGGLPLLATSTLTAPDFRHVPHERGEKGGERGKRRGRKMRRTHTESQCESGNAGKGPDRMGYRDR